MEDSNLITAINAYKNKEISKSSISVIIKSILKKDIETPNIIRGFKHLIEIEQSPDSLSDLYWIFESLNTERSQVFTELMEETLGERFIKNYNVHPREAMALGLVEKIIGQELLNEANYPELHHVHAAFKIKEGHIIDLDIVEVCCPSIQFLKLLPNLISLRMSMTGLKEFKGFNSMSKLEWLSLNSNAIKEIQNIQLLKNLSLLEIDSNPVERIIGINKLKMLTEIVVYDTKISNSTKIKINKHINSNRLRIAKERDKKLRKAERNAKKGEYQGAIENFKEVIKLSKSLHPGGYSYHLLLSPKEWHDLAIVYLKIGRYEKALNICELAIKLDSHNKELLKLQSKIIKLKSKT
ncbi:MAG: tetratricopeptide repeat protein [Candidatus Thorarchaeota archaeon]